MNLWHMLCQALGFIISNTYFAVKNYGLTIIIFTVIVKIIFFPLTYKQQRSMFEMRKIQPLLDELQKKYKDDKEKLGNETINLYKQHNINPLAGCLTTLLQLPVIVALFDVVTKPMTYMFGFSQQNVADVTAALGISDGINVSQLTLMTELAGRGADFVASLGLPDFQLVDFNFLGLNLADVPSFFRFSPLWIIPLLSGFSTWLGSKLMTPPVQEDDKDNPMAQSQSSMLVMMPFMTAFFAFKFPAAVGLYWIVNNIIQVVQQLLFNRFLENNHPSFGKSVTASDCSAEPKNSKHEEMLIPTSDTAPNVVKKSNKSKKNKVRKNNKK